jgi:serine/threonine-protein phosphatase 5
MAEFSPDTAPVISPDANPEAKLAAATAFKDMGNEHLAQCKYHLAVEEYTKAIELYPTAIFYANRAQAMLKMESYGLAIEDATEALK